MILPTQVSNQFGLLGCIKYKNYLLFLKYFRIISPPFFKLLLSLLLLLIFKFYPLDLCFILLLLNWLLFLQHLFFFFFLSIPFSLSVLFTLCTSFSKSIFLHLHLVKLIIFFFPMLFVIKLIALLFIFELTMIF